MEIGRKEGADRCGDGYDEGYGDGSREATVRGET